MTHESSDSSETLLFRREHFATRLPLACLYTPSHCWLRRLPEEGWRVGLTKFATRMLGELVEHEFQVKPGAAVKRGDIIGWIEGFKAISDVYCVGTGRFLRGNPALTDRITLVNDDPHGEGWLYEFSGEPDPDHLDAPAYRDLLNATIDRMLARRPDGGAS